MAEIDDFDLDRSTAQAWTEFEARLAEVISMIDDSADLTIATDVVHSERGPYVTFHAVDAGTVRAEAAGNAELGDHFQLGAEQVEAMCGLGWQRPDAGSPLGRTAFWAEAPQEDCERIAELAVAALRDVYRVQHPVFLAPDHLAEVLRPRGPTEPVVVPGAGLQRIESTGFASVLPRSRQHLTQLVDAELAAMFGHPPIRDDEGDVAIRVGSTM